MDMSFNFKNKEVLVKPILTPTSLIIPNRNHLFLSKLCICEHSYPDIQYPCANMINRLYYSLP